MRTSGEIAEKKIVEFERARSVLLLILASVREASYKVSELVGSCRVVIPENRHGLKGRTASYSHEANTGAADARPHPREPLFRATRSLPPLPPMNLCEYSQDSAEGEGVELRTVLTGLLSKLLHGVMPFVAMGQRPASTRVRQREVGVGQWRVRMRCIR